MPSLASWAALRSTAFRTQSVSDEMSPVLSAMPMNLAHPVGRFSLFMIRSIAEEAGTRMPSFFGYIVRYSAVFLLPGFIAVTLIFF
jgi:hypothetical protein